MRMKYGSVPHRPRQIFERKGAQAITAGSSQETSIACEGKPLEIGPRVRDASNEAPLGFPVPRYEGMWGAWGSAPNPGRVHDGALPHPCVRRLSGRARMSVGG